jgi:integrase
MRAEDPCHELPLAVFGSEGRPRPIPHILSTQDVHRLIKATCQRGLPSLRRDTYSTLFALLACTGLRVSEAIRLRYEHITSDGLLIKDSKFGKSRLVVLHESVRAALERYLQKRRPFVPFDDHVFVSLRKKPLRTQDIDAEFRAVVKEIGLPSGAGKPRLSPHSLRHYFAVRALEGCPDGRDRITKHMMAVSAYLGHSSVAHTYWYLEATPELMKDIAECSERFVKRAKS